MADLLDVPPPPYGVMPRQYFDNLAERGGFPEVWPERAGPPERFVRACADLMRFPLAVDAPWQLLAHEVAVTMRMTGLYSKPVQLAQGPTTTLHSTLFVQEDHDTFGKSLDLYCPGLASRLGVDFTAIMTEGDDRHCGSVDLVLKQEFQRARPYQAVYMLERAGHWPASKRLEHQAGYTMLSPAYPGGHCYESTIDFAFARCRLDAMGAALSAAEIAGLAAYSADVGDRRIMAGLHYPLDSVGSWLLASRMIAASFPADYVDAALDFAAQAITKSRVFAELDAPGNSAHHYGAVRRYLAAKLPQLDRYAAT